MGREMRRVPSDWKHPKDHTGQYEPLYDGYGIDLNRFEAMVDKKGMAEALDYFGGGPQTDDYMPDWTEEERTHYMMYEATSEGTPISPAFDTPERLAQWLVDNEASAFGGSTASYEAWLRVCQGGYAPSAVGIPGGGLISGVEAMIIPGMLK